MIATLVTWRRPIAAVCISAALALAYVAFVGPALNRPASIPLGKGDYALTTTTGAPFTQAALRGQRSAVFFGFTHCPEVCPTTLADIDLWQSELGDAAADMTFYFVTVDPARDTLDVLGDYVGWVPNVVGVTGTAQDIRQAEKAFRIVSRKIPLSDGEYTMDHSAYIMLFDDRGEFFEPIAYQEPLPQVMAKLTRLLDS